MEINWNNIPTNPGVYLWKGINDQVIYVGKAKNLRNRMKQYFKGDLTPKTRLLVKNIVDFDFQVSTSEMDALILEQNLINEYEPKYNIKIKSAKTYPYIELKTGNNIKLSVTKTTKYIKNTKYYGPYPDGFSARRIINLLSSVLPLDNCLAPNSGKPCLNYEMGKCLGKCIGIDSSNERKFVIDSIENFFKGKTKYFEDQIRERIEINNKMLNFEESQKLVENLDFIEKINAQRSNTFKDSKHRDIINYYSENGIISISIMHVRFGNVSMTTNFMNKQFNPDPLDSLESFIYRFYDRNLVPDEIVIPFDLDWDSKIKVRTTNPKIGTKKDLLDTVCKHAKAKYVNNIDGYLNKIKSYEEALSFLKRNVSPKDIHTIEMVDISSTMGAEQVGAIIQFKNGEPRKSKYRKYIIRNVQGMDDYAATTEVVKRHFKAKIEKNEEMPDLFIVDGKNQLKNAEKIFDELKIDNVILAGLIKDDKHTTNAIINNEMDIFKLNRNEQMYLFLQRIQDEVHRFVINFHRSRREKIVLESQLDQYTFLTETDKQNLFKEFKSIRKILIASETELRKVISKTKVEKFMKERE